MNNNNIKNKNKNWKMIKNKGKNIRRKEIHLAYTKIASFNLKGGLWKACNKELLVKDMIKQKIDIACLQETRPKKDFMINSSKGILIGLAGSNDNKKLRYGQGFFISKRWADRFIDYKKVNDRISIIRFNVNTELTSENITYFSIINIYSPTENKDTEEFYKDINKIYEELKKYSKLVMIAGDFNAKLGNRLGNENFLGKYSQNCPRNDNGSNLAEFLVENDLIATNTFFKHKPNRITTWISPNNTYSNQIDYILIPQKFRTIITNSRSYENLNYPSDHKMVITTISLKKISICISKIRQIQMGKKDLLDHSALIHDETVRSRYTQELTRALNNNHTNISTEKLINRSIKKSDKICLPLQQKVVNGKIIYYNDLILNMLHRKRNKIKRNHRYFKNDSKLKKELNRESRKNKKAIKERIKILDSQMIINITSEIEKNRMNRSSFKIQRLLCGIKKNKDLKLYDKNKYRVTKPLQILPLIDKMYDPFFDPIGINPVIDFIIEPSSLIKPINCTEASSGTNKLNNYRSPGPDGESAESYKCGGPRILEELCKLLNNMFETNTYYESLGMGYLNVINKPNKPYTIENTRPITAVSTKRKILSHILLNRIYDRVEAYLSAGQSGFRIGRSTADIVFAKRIEIDIANKYKESFLCSSLDIQKAFDSIDRNLLIQIFEETICPPNSDESRILRVLLSNTKVVPIIKGFKGKTIRTTVGVPQGDPLSPILFAIYSEYILKKFNSQSTHIPKITDTETLYADDITLNQHLSTNHVENEVLLNLLHPITNLLPIIFREFNLKIDNNKSKDFLISRFSDISNIKVLGNYININEDINYKISEANRCFQMYNNIWSNKNNKISLDLKIKIYNIMVKSKILYNITCLPLGSNSKYEKKLDIIHRRHLRKILHINNPQDISTKDVYDRTKSIPLHIQITKLRWKYFGRLFKLDPMTPAIKLLKNYFEDNNRKKYSGFEITSLPYIMHQDLLLISKSLKNINDLNNLLLLANDQKSWDLLIVKEIYKKKLEIWNSQMILKYDSCDDINSLNYPFNNSYRVYIPFNWSLKFFDQFGKNGIYILFIFLILLIFTLTMIFLYF